jgi:hypothetical protein
LRSTASTLLNEEGAFDGDVVEAQIAHDTEKKRRRRDEVLRRQLGGREQYPRHLYRAACWAERVRLMQHWSDRLDSLRDGAPAVLLRRSAAQLALVSTPQQESVIFIHAVEVDHGLASHLVGPNPLVGDQLISLSLSEFAMAATVLELDEPALLVVIIVNHGSCMCFDDLRHNRIKPR